MYRWKAYNYRDIEQTFRLLGHTVDNIEQELGNYDIDPEFEAKIEAMMEKLFCTDLKFLPENGRKICVMDV